MVSQTKKTLKTTLTAGSETTTETKAETEK